MKKGIKWILFLLLFTAAAVGVTYGLIQYTLQAREPDPTPAPQEAGIDLDGTYDQNHLLITEEQEGSDIAYPRIDGLKNAEVETAVNDMIAAKVEEIKTYHQGNGSSISYLTYQVYANFGNALSIGLFSADGKHNDRQDYLNIDLNDGSLITLEELFCAGADIQTPVRNGFYEVLTRYNLSADYWEELSYPDENELYRVVRGYLAGERTFSFSASEIYLHYEDYTAVVPMVEYAEDIAVYHRFLSEDSLFEGDDIGYKNIFTCAEMPRAFARREFAMVGNNLWYDIAMDEVYFEDSVPQEVRDKVNAFADGVYGNLLAEAETLRETAGANPDRAYILLAEPSVFLWSDSEYVDGYWVSEPSKAVTVNENYKLYEMDYALFDSILRDTLVQTYRENPYSVVYFGLGDDLEPVRRDGDALYLYETGQQLTVEDLFADGYDYDSAIRAQAKYDLVSYYGYTMEEAELVAQSVTYTLAGSGIEIRLPHWDEEQFIWKSIGDFNRENMTIYQ